MRAMTAPLMRYAVGSPDELFCRHATLVPSIRPRSLRRLRIFPSISSSLTRHFFPSFREFNVYIFFHGILPCFFCKKFISHNYYMIVSLKRSSRIEAVIVNAKLRIDSCAVSDYFNSADTLILRIFRSLPYCTSPRRCSPNICKNI